MQIASRLTGLVSMLLLAGCSRPDVIVTDQSGKPIEGARVTGTSLTISGQLTMTNAKGEAQIPRSVQETKWLTITKPGYTGVEWIDLSQSKPIVVKLTPSKNGN